VSGDLYTIAAKLTGKFTPPDRRIKASEQTL
jgi:hypothetical protein